MNEYGESILGQSDQEVTQDLTRGVLLQQIAEVAFSDDEEDKKELDRLTAKYDALKPDPSSPAEVVIREAERLEILEYLRQRASRALLAGNIESFDVTADIYGLMSQSFSDETGKVSNDPLFQEIPPYIEDFRNEIKKELFDNIIECKEPKLEILKIIGEYAVNDDIEKPNINGYDFDKCKNHSEKIEKLTEKSNPY